MNRTWYGIGTTQMHLSKFWEICTWNSSGDHSLGKNCYSNHTITWAPNGKKSDFGVWAGHVKGGNNMGLTVTLPVCGGIPVADTNMIMLNFPEKDSFSGFWTYVQSISGDICIFALTPHVSDELYQAEIARLGKEHGYSEAQLAKIKKVAWPKDCKVGDSLEESTNIEGKGATLNAEYAAKKKVK